MTTKPSKTDPWEMPNSDKFNFSEHAKNLDAQELFSQPDLPPAIGLRQFLNSETRLRAATSGSSTTLIPGRLYLRQQPSGLWELCLNKGRGCFDCWVSESREEMLALAESLQEGGN